VEGKIVYCNDAFVRLFGFDSQSDLMDTPVIRLYRNKMDRGNLVQAILQRGQVVDTPIAYIHRDGSHIWCAVTAKAVLDDDGMVVFLDGTLRNITGEIEDDLTDLKRDVHFSSENLSVFILDVQGRFIKANDAAHRLLGVSRGQLDGKAITDFFPESDRDVFLILLGDIRKMGREEAVLRLRDALGCKKLIEITAIIVKTEGRAHHVKLIAKDVTERVKIAEESRNIEKFQGVLEMAGGVAHRLNQPLTVVTNVINELLTTMASTDQFYNSVQKAHAQIMLMNEITNKIGNIKKYAAVDYVAGVKIVDIDQAS
jgi:PAS domain S-box-containing protein